jgi:hypothetical protein
MAVSDRYAAFVKRVWDRIETLTGHAPFYVDATHICSYCPLCLEGTVMFRFVERPRPQAFPSSQSGGEGGDRDCRGAYAVSSHGFSDEDLDAIERRKNGDKPRPKGKIPYLPDRTATLPELREWASNAAGLPPEVRVETITRPGRDPSDPLSIYLSNGVELRCEHQKQLQMPRTLQAFLASESDGIAQPSYLSPAEVGDFYIALCRLGTAAARTNARSALSEQLAAFVELTAEVPGSIVDRARRYDMLQTLRARPTFDRADRPAGVERRPVAQGPFDPLSAARGGLMLYQRVSAYPYLTHTGVSLARIRVSLIGTRGTLVQSSGATWRA